MYQCIIIAGSEHTLYHGFCQSLNSSTFSEENPKYTNEWIKVGSESSNSCQVRLSLFNTIQSRPGPSHELQLLGEWKCQLYSCGFLGPEIFCLLSPKAIISSGTKSST